jgi:hypothetical protein
MPDLLADRQPIIFRSDNAGDVRWGVRTGGFAGLGEAKGFCQAISARGLSCYVIGSESNLPSGAAHAIDGPSNGASASVVPPSGGSPSVGPANDAPPSGVPLSDGPSVQLSSTTSSDAAAAEWRRIQKRMPDLLANRQPIMFRSENAGGVRWGVRTAGFAGLEEAKGFCQAVSTRGFTCYVIGS